MKRNFLLLYPNSIFENYDQVIRPEYFALAKCIEGELQRLVFMVRYFFLRKKLTTNGVKTTFNSVNFNIELGLLCKQFYSWIESYFVCSFDGLRGTKAKFYEPIFTMIYHLIQSDFAFSYDGLFRANTKEIKSYKMSFVLSILRSKMYRSMNTLNLSSQNLKKCSFLLNLCLFCFICCSS